MKRRLQGEPEVIYKNLNKLRIPVLADKPTSPKKLDNFLHSENMSA
jgi:hypothetical protein